HVAAAACDVLQPTECRIALVTKARRAVADLVDLLALFVLRRTNELGALDEVCFVLRQERVHADDGQPAGVLLLLVEEALLLDLAALVHGLHRAEHAAAQIERLELLEHGFLDEVRELLDERAALPRVLVLREAELAVDDELNRERAAHA